jgi:hypothetical protein
MMIQIKRLAIISTLILAYSCSVKKQQVITHAQPLTDEFIRPEQFAFIEFIQTKDGEVLSGAAPQGRRIDGPTYHFDKETKQLDIYRKVDFLVDTLKAILGNGGILKGAAGSGLSLRLTPIGKFPFTMNRLTIVKVSSQGVHIIYNNEEAIIKEGEEWKRASSTIDTIKMETPAIIRFTTTSSVRYHGMVDKKGVAQ